MGYNAKYIHYYCLNFNNINLFVSIFFVRFELLLRKPSLLFPSLQYFTERWIQTNSTSNGVYCVSNNYYIIISYCLHRSNDVNIFWVNMFQYHYWKVIPRMVPKFSVVVSTGTKHFWIEFKAKLIWSQFQQNCFLKSLTILVIDRPVLN